MDDAITVVCGLHHKLVVASGVILVFCSIELRDVAEDYPDITDSVNSIY